MEASGKMSTRIDSRTEMGAVRLAVRDLPGMKNYYQEVIGLSLIHEGSDFVHLGVDGRPLVRLNSRLDGMSSPNSPGLFHLAILLPNRPELGRWLYHYVEKGLRLDGVGDHLVSEALYLSDPEGNGIEMYRDRPRESWEYNNGQVRMDTFAVDLRLND